MKVLIFTPIEGRQKITDLFLMGVERLRQESGHEIDLFCVCSTDEDKGYLASKGVEHCVYPNKPLSDKFDYGFKQALKKDFDYILRLGSDDLLDHTVFPNYYNSLMTAGTPFFGLKTIGLVNFSTLESCVFRYYTHRNDMLLGGGSMLSRELCLRFKDIPLYSKRPLNRGLDNASEQELKRFATPVIVKTDKPVLIDVKSEVNLWPYSHISRRQAKIDFAELTHFTSKQEDQLFKKQQDFSCVAVIPVKGRLPLLKHTIVRLLTRNGVNKVICVGDSENEKQLAESSGAEFIYHENKPLGKKWNAGFEAAKKYNPECCLFVGSSDWISDNWIDYCRDYLNKYDMIGKPDFNLLDYGKELRLCHWAGYTDPRRKDEPIGIGRLLSRRILEKMNWKPMEDRLDSSLDWSMFQKVKSHGGAICLLRTDEIQSLSLSTSAWENKHSFASHWRNDKGLESKKMEAEPFLKDWFPEGLELQTQIYERKEQ